VRGTNRGFRLGAGRGLPWLLVAGLLGGFSPASGAPETARIHEFGTLRHNAVLAHRFRIENPGASAWTIRKVRPSCACFQVLSFPDRVPPGQAAEVHVRLVPDACGPVGYKLFVELDGAPEPVMVFALRGRVTPAEQPVSDLRNVVADGLFVRRLVPEDAACYVSGGVVRARMQEEVPPVLVDVRDAQDFARVHIPGSRNLPPYQLKAQTALKRRPVVILDEGHGSLRLEEQCRALREAGFEQVEILQDGLLGWCRAGGRLDGSPADRQRLSLLTPSEFFVMQRDRDLSVVTVGSSGCFDYLLPERLHLAGEADPLVQLRAGAGPASRANRAMVLVSDSPSAERVLCELAAYTDLRVFVLQGGIEAYEQFLKRSTALRQRDQRSTQKRAVPGVTPRLTRGCGCS